MKTLSLTNTGKLTTSGAGQITTIFTTELADALLNLPPFGTESIQSYLSQLTTKSRQSLDRLINIDATLGKKREVLVARHPILFSTPSTLRVKGEDILEELFVDCPPIGMLIFTVHGERLIAPRLDDWSTLYTFDEFYTKFNRSVEEHLELTAGNKVKLLKRAIELSAIKAPQTYEVSFATSDNILPTRTVLAYSREQIDLYARRLRATVMSADVVSNTNTKE